MMNSVCYIYRAKLLPSPKELHCLWATLTDKSVMNRSDVDFRISQQGRVISVVSSLALPTELVSLETNSFEFVRQFPQKIGTYQSGQVVRMQGRLAYSVHRSLSRKDECPVDYGGSIKPALKEQFLNYMTHQTGLDFISAERQGKSLALARENLSTPEDKVWLNDVISFDVVGSVVCAETLNKLPIRAIGRRKSYGMGTALVLGASQPEMAPESEMAEL